MDKQFIDLHLHTSFSDGIFTPEQVANAASEMNLSAISLTDHDTIEGCSHLAEHCKKKGIEFISGTELSVDIEGNEMHLLGYFLDINNQILSCFLLSALRQQFCNSTHIGMTVQKMFTHIKGRLINNVPAGKL